MNFLKFLKNNLKRHFLFGIATFIPAYVTIILLLKIVSFFDNIIKNTIKIFYLPPLVNKFLTYPGVGAFFSVIFLVLLGFFSRQYLGKGIMQIVEKLFTLFPISKQIYISVKKMTDSLINKDDKNFKRVVMVPFPHQDVYAIGFLTGEVPTTTDNIKRFYVYVPTAINPTSGFLITVEESMIVNNDMSVEEAFALILSGGMASSKKLDR